MRYIHERPTTGEILKKYREDSNLKQGDLASEFSCSAQLISQIERNERTLTSDMQDKYFKKFDISYAEKEDIAFYEDFRVSQPRTKTYIRDLEELVEELKKEVIIDQKVRQIIEFVKTLALKDFL